MNRLRLPIVVTPPPPVGAAVDRDELAEDVAVGRSPAASARPDTSGPAARGRSRRYGKISLPSPIVVCLRSPPRRRPCSCVRCVTCGPITANGPTDRALADRRRSGARARADRSRRVGVTTSSSSASTTVCPSTSATAVAFTSGPRVAPSVTTSFSRSPGTTCLRNLAPSTPRSCTPRPCAPGELEQQERRGLGQRLDHEDRRHAAACPGNVPGKNLR